MGLILFNEEPNLGSNICFSSVNCFSPKVSPLYLLAGCGLVGAGLVLNQVVIWPAFEKTPSLLGLIPPLIVLQENM